MADREKVMQWLKTCANGCEDGCPYEYKNLVYRVECKADLMRDALSLLKEQEPHLLTLDEADAAEVVWFEARNHIFIEPMLTRGKRLSDEAEDWFQYGRDWRCWSARPSDKQREEAPWDEITG